MLFYFKSSFFLITLRNIASLSSTRPAQHVADLFIPISYTYILFLLYTQKVILKIISRLPSSYLNCRSFLEINHKIDTL